MQALFDSEEHKLTSPLTLEPWGGTHEGNSESHVSGDTRAAPSGFLLPMKQWPGSVTLEGWITDV